MVTDSSSPLLVFITAVVVVVVTQRQPQRQPQRSAFYVGWRLFVVANVENISSISFSSWLLFTLYAIFDLSNAKFVSCFTYAPMGWYRSYLRRSPLKCPSVVFLVFCYLIFIIYYFIYYLLFSFNSFLLFKLLSCFTLPQWADVEHIYWAACSIVQVLISLFLLLSE